MFDCFSTSFMSHLSQQTKLEATWSLQSALGVQSIEPTWAHVYLCMVWTSSTERCLNLENISNLGLSFSECSQTSLLTTIAHNHDHELITILVHNNQLQGSTNSHTMRQYHLQLLDDPFHLATAEVSSFGWIVAPCDLRWSNGSESVTLLHRSTSGTNGLFLCPGVATESLAHQYNHDHLFLTINVIFIVVLAIVMINHSHPVIITIVIIFAFISLVILTVVLIVVVFDIRRYPQAVCIGSY